MRGQFFIKYSEIAFVVGVIIILIFIFADMKMDIIYFRQQVFELQEEQKDLEAIRHSYQNLIVHMVLRNKITMNDLDAYLPEFEKVFIRQRIEINKRSN